MKITESATSTFWKGEQLSLIHIFNGYATAVAGAILAKGKATAKQTVKNTVKVTIYPATIRANSHDVTISVLAKDTTNQLKACLLYTSSGCFPVQTGYWWFR